MSEFISIQVGQCGNQIGSAFWPLVLEEYGISYRSTGNSNKPHPLEESFASFFNCPEGVPSMALLIDMEARVVNRFQQGLLKNLFDTKLTLKNHPGSGNNWAVGHHTHYLQQKHGLEEVLRRAVEQCDSLQGFLIQMSLAGGTGAGLGTALVRHLQDQFPRIHRAVTCVHPGQCNEVITSPYNIALSLRILSEHASSVIPVDNKALLDICCRHRITRGVLPFHEVNSIIVNMLLNLTSGSRFSGSLPFDVSDLAMLAPRPGLHYFSASVSPVDITPKRGMNIVYKNQNLLYDVCLRGNQMLKVNAMDGRIINAALFCRGNVSLETLTESITKLRAKVRFVEWSHPSVKAGLCSVPPIGYDVGLLCLANSTNMSNLFTDSLRQFNRLYKRKAHVHHYTCTDGFEENDFLLTAESLKTSAADYSRAGAAD